MKRPHAWVQCLWDPWEVDIGTRAGISRAILINRPSDIVSSVHSASVFASRAYGLWKWRNVRNHSLLDSPDLDIGVRKQSCARR